MFYRKNRIAKLSLHNAFWLLNWNNAERAALKDIQWPTLLKDSKRYIPSFQIQISTNLKIEQYFSNFSVPCQHVCVPIDIKINKITALQSQFPCLIGQYHGSEWSDISWTRRYDKSVRLVLIIDVPSTPSPTD